jgi:alkanesulfonate monooxygenase SsuD/methylene tetrahydromethanopterin reductase-like flavin-dependent oxidoreductase (luciferase family)
MIRIAARLGVGALLLAFVDPSEAAAYAKDYYETLKAECVPLGATINPNIAMVAGFACHPKEKTAVNRVIEGVGFFGFSLAHILLHGWQQPDTDLWQEFKRQPTQIYKSITRGIGTPHQVRFAMQQYADAGVDQVVLIQPAGSHSQQEICESLKLFAEDVMPDFHERESEREQKKLAELAPYFETAMERKMLLASQHDERSVIPLRRHRPRRSERRRAA